MYYISNIDISKYEVFEKLDEFAKFYDDLSYTTSGFVTFPMTQIININTFMFISISQTLNSIKEVLSKLRFSDAYTLLRKYYDSFMINIYVNLSLHEKIDINNIEFSKINELLNKEIDNWYNGKNKIKDFGNISKYIENSEKLKPITFILNKNKSNYDAIRERCNDFVHNNFYKNFVLNDYNSETYKNLDLLNTFSNDLILLFIKHFAYLFYLDDTLMRSSDYMDALEAGMTPEEDSQYWVAPFIQDIFDKYVKTYNPEIAKEIIKNTNMMLE